MVTVPLPLCSPSACPPSQLWPPQDQPHVLGGLTLDAEGGSGTSVCLSSLSSPLAHPSPGLGPRWSPPRCPCADEPAGCSVRCIWVLWYLQVLRGVAGGWAWLSCARPFKGLCCVWTSQSAQAAPESICGHETVSTRLLDKVSHWQNDASNCVNVGKPVSVCRCLCKDTWLLCVLTEPAEIHFFPSFLVAHSFVPPFLRPCPPHSAVLSQVP